MTAAIFALTGTLIGVLGTLAVELARGRALDKRSHREAVRIACADFSAAVARMVNLAIEVKNPDSIRLSKMHDAHLDARVCYERLRLISGSRDVQEAGRYVLRYTFGLLRMAEERPPRPDEQEKSPRLLLQDWLVKLYAEVRQEIGVPNPRDIFREPDEWLGGTHWRHPTEVEDRMTSGQGSDSSGLSD
jgi:hypothetical protein